MSNELIIYGAAYGRADVTGIVRSLRKAQKLSVKASNEVFGDSWPEVKKTLVVVYSYGNATVQQQVAREGESLNIFQPQNSANHKRSDRLCLSLKSIVTPSRQQQSLKLNILGAAYGLANVTSKAQCLVTSNQEFNQLASNEVWGDGWPGQAKTLVVVYECNKHYLVDIAVENYRVHFIASPPLKILDAAYGLQCVTEKVKELVHHRSFEATANNATFGDGWPGTAKTLVIVYQYGEEQPSVAAAKETEKLMFQYSKKGNFYGSTNPNTLTILGAAYGPSDVTEKVRSFVKDGSTLEVKASNDVFGDTWYGQPKSLVTVYRYGRGAPQMQVVHEHASMSVSIPYLTPNVDLVEVNNLLEDGDVFALAAINGDFISCDLSNRLVASKAKAEEGCKLTVKKYGSSSPLKIQSDNGKYVIVGEDNYLYATGNAENAESFTISVSTKGGLRLSTKAGMYIRLDSYDQNLLKADAWDYLPAYTIFDIAFQQTEAVLSKQLLISDELTVGDLALVAFIWSLVGGFFLAIGLGPFIATGEARPGLLNLIRSSPAAWRALMNFKDAIIASPRNITAVITGGLGVITVLYKEGLLWKLFKLLLKLGVWWIITKVIAKIIQVIFIPETEVAELLASFAAWSTQLVESGLGVGQACN
mgnify:FL=1